MIAKKVARRRDSQSSFSALGKYILREGDSEGQAAVTYTRVSNCQLDVPILAMKEIEATQSRNTRSQSDKTYHLVISFAEGEHPSDEALVDIENTLCASIGYGDHQRLSVLHTDTDNVHLHVAINKIHPVTLNNIEVIRDFYRLDEACQAMEKQHGLLIDNRIERDKGKELDQSSRREDEKAADQSNPVDIHGGIKSFKSWLYTQFKNGLADELAGVETWEQFHACLKSHDLEIKPYKKGLVIGSISEQVFAKASEFVDDFGKNKLEEKLGPYEVCSDAVKRQAPDKAVYEKRPVQSTVNQVLWDHYQKTQKTIMMTKRALYEDIRHRRLLEEKRIKIHFSELRKEVKASWILSKRDKWKMYQSLHSQKTDLLKGVRSSYHEEIGEMHTKYVRRIWQDFLLDESMKGDVVALKALRSRESRKIKGAQKNGLAGTDNVLMLRKLKPVNVRPNGDVLYDVGGMSVRDNGHALLVEHSDPKTVDLVLRLGIEKYGTELTIEGSEYFKMSVVNAASDKGVAVKFTNPELESRRQFLETVKLSVVGRDKTNQASQNNPNKLHQSKKSSISQVEEWIDHRNQVRVRTQENKPYRLFKPEDKGEYHYGGTRKLPNGSVVALYESPSTVLVALISSKQHYVLRGQKVGTMLNIDKNGYGKANDKKDSRGR